MQGLNGLLHANLESLFFRKMSELVQHQASSIVSGFSYSFSLRQTECRTPLKMIMSYITTTRSNHTLQTHMRNTSYTLIWHHVSVPQSLCLGDLIRLYASGKAELATVLATYVSCSMKLNVKHCGHAPLTQYGPRIIFLRMFS